MIIRFNIDAETGLPHIYEHGVTEDEVRQVLTAPLPSGCISKRPGARQFVCCHGV